MRKVFMTTFFGALVAGSVFASTVGASALSLPSTRHPQFCRKHPAHCIQVSIATDNYTRVTYFGN